jgi:hypothetical protein
MDHENVPKLFRLSAPTQEAPESSNGLENAVELDRSFRVEKDVWENLPTTFLGPAKLSPLHGSFSQGLTGPCPVKRLTVALRCGLGVGDGGGVIPNFPSSRSETQFV